eukprot:g23727.t1
MTFYQLWGHWNALDESFAWIREKAPSGRSGGAGGSPGTAPGAGGERPEEASAQPTVYRRVGKHAKPRGAQAPAGRGFNPVIGRPIQLPELASSSRKDDITKVLQTLQLIRSRSGQGLAESGQDHISYA